LASHSDKKYFINKFNGLARCKPAQANFKESLFWALIDLHINRILCGSELASEVEIGG
jgi:hypothetical protein